jgi:hypothetical protein
MMPTTATNVTVMDNVVNGLLDPDIDAIDGNTTIIATNLTFTNPESMDFSIQSTLAARNAGTTSLFLTTDYIGTLRDATLDIGLTSFQVLCR